MSESYEVYFCVECATRWRKFSDSWSLYPGDTAGPCCDNSDDFLSKIRPWAELDSGSASVSSGGPAYEKLRAWLVGEVDAMRRGERSKDFEHYVFEMTMYAVYGPDWASWYGDLQDKGLTE